MHWHYHLGHLSFNALKQLALWGEIPKKLASIRLPHCAGCLYGAMTKIPWWGKEHKYGHATFTIIKLGECVSVNQLISTKAGLFGQNRGALSKKHYRSSLTTSHASSMCI